MSALFDVRQRISIESAKRAYYISFGLVAERRLRAEECCSSRQPVMGSDDQAESSRQGRRPRQGRSIKQKFERLSAVGKTTWTNKQ